MNTAEAIEALQALLGINDEFDDAIDEAIYALEFLQKTQKNQIAKQRTKLILQRVKSRVKFILGGGIKWL